MLSRHYIVYWREKEHEKYLEQVDRKNHLLFFSALDHDGHFTDNIVDESVDVEKIVETQMMIEAVRSAITRLNAEEIKNRILYSRNKDNQRNKKDTYDCGCRGMLSCYSAN